MARPIRRPRIGEGPFDDVATARRAASEANERLGGPGFRSEIGLGEGEQRCMYAAEETAAGRWHVVLKPFGGGD